MATVKLFAGEIAVDVVVKRDGTVICNGEMAGHIEKSSGLSVTHCGRVSNTGWVAYGLDGQRLLEGTCRRRQDAVNVVVECAQPIHVKDMTLSLHYGQLWTAFVYVEGHCFGVDRAPREKDWFVHFIATRGSVFPGYSTTEGTRPARTVSRPDVVNALNAAAKAAGASF